MNWAIRAEEPGDAAAIRAVIEAAFARHPHSDGTEPDIVERLRAASHRLHALVAVAKDGAILGHIAFSPVTVSDGARGWFGLGPLAVLPHSQGRGIGSALVEAGLARLRETGAAGCVVLGEPGYYGRFGFAHDPALEFPGVPPEYLQRLVLTQPGPCGTIAYAPAFG